MATRTSKPAVSATAVTGAGAGAGAEQQLTCFVVTGFGNKTDYSTGRVLNLDKTYELLVQPACDKVNVNCFRAIDANLTGSIDSIMYRWIYQADLVIAVLSTLNANVFYELGVRHAQRPNTTIIIAESVLIQRIPFDLSSFVVHKYEHGGESISKPEQERFVAHLSVVLGKLIGVEQRRQKDSPLLGAETDSPVFKHLEDMTPPIYKSDSYVEPPPYIPPDQRKKAAVKAGEEDGETLASLIDAAEAAKKKEQFEEAIRLFGMAIQRQTQVNVERKAVGKADPKPDLFLVQRLALVTYKHGERKDEKTGLPDTETARKALFEAMAILDTHCQPRESNDPETLGLSGAINKRLFELTADRAYLDQAIKFYERGFYVKRDYYNGINVAYMYNLRANLQDQRFDAIVDYGHANMIRRLVVDICEGLVNDGAAFANRGDKEWVYMTLSEGYQGLGRSADEARLAPQIDRVQSDFGKKSFIGQRAKLQAAMDEFRRKFHPDDLAALPAVATEAKPAAAGPGPAGGAPAREPALRPAGASGGRAITVDADIAPDR